jgi:tetratricopeptide (TPR) repeat protein
MSFFRRILGALASAFHVLFWPFRSVAHAFRQTWGANIKEIFHDRALALLEQYREAHQHETLQAAMKMSRFAAQLTPPLKSHPRRTEILRTYHFMLLEQSKTSHSPMHMVDALMTLNESLDFLPNDDPYAVEAVNFMIRISNTYLGSRRHIELDSDDVRERNLKRCQILYLVSDRYFTRFEEQQNLADLVKGCKVMRIILLHAPEDTEDLLFWFGKLAYYLMEVYARDHDLELLMESIRHCRQGLAIAPDGSDETKAHVKNVYAHALLTQVTRSSDTEGLDFAINLSLEAVAATSSPQSKVVFLNNLGNILEHRFDRIHRVEDLCEAIRVTRFALGFNPDGILLGNTKANIGAKLLKLPSRQRSTTDLEEAVTLLTEAVDSMEALKVPPAWLNSLSVAYRHRYANQNNMEDLEAAIRYRDQALRLMSEQSPDRPDCAVNMALLLQSRAMQTHTRIDLDTALSLAEDAARSVPQNHVQNAHVMFGLARLYIHAQTVELGGVFELVGDSVRWTPPWEDRAIEIYSKSLHDPLGQATIRMVAAAQLMRIFEKRGQYSQGVDVGRQALEILHKTNTRLLSRDDQQRIVADFSDIAVETCALSIQSDGSADRALELLELGRGLILGLLVEDQSDLSAVAKSHPQEAAQFNELRNNISRPARVGENVASGLDSIACRDRQVRELDQMVVEIRRLPGHERFLRKPAAEDMQAHAAGGHIVVINVADQRSDAILVSSSHSEVLHLPTLTKKGIRDWIDKDTFHCEKRSETGRKNKLCHEFLRWLWTTCVRPVLSALNLLNKSSLTELPRIWWIGTGLAASLPFHAAGDHLSGRKEDAYAYIVSSYTPTIRVLGYAQQRASALQKETVRRPEVLVVLMPTTPDVEGVPVAALTNTTEELAVVTAAIHATHAVRSLDRPSCQDVLFNLPSCDLVHFACHGVSNPVDPSNSFLILQKQAEQQPLSLPIPDRLTVQSIVQTHLGRSRIAYLSACSTAENMADQLVDEVIHLASGFQVAGFPHVIGSLWPTDDQVSVTMAGAFYRQVSAQHPASDKAIALALRDAVLGVRGHFPRQPLLWAQYVHIGV